MSGQIEVKLHVALYFKYLKSVFKVSKNLEFFLEIANDVHYKPVKSQYHIFCILGYTKITKSDKL
jgi:hypothetical protein